MLFEWQTIVRHLSRRLVKAHWLNGAVKWLSAISIHTVFDFKTIVVCCCKLNNTSIHSRQVSICKGSIYFWYSPAQMCTWEECLPSKWAVRLLMWNHESKWADNNVFTCHDKISKRSLLLSRSLSEKCRHTSARWRWPRCRPCTLTVIQIVEVAVNWWVMMGFRFAAQ